MPMESISKAAGRPAGFSRASQLLRGGKAFVRLGSRCPLDVATDATLVSPDSLLLRGCSSVSRSVCVCYVRGWRPVVIFHVSS